MAHGTDTTGLIRAQKCLDEKKVVMKYYLGRETKHSIKDEVMDKAASLETTKLITA